MKNNLVGFTEGFHTESLAIINDDVCYFYPKGFDPNIVESKEIAFYEKPFLKRTRQLYAGQHKTALGRRKLKLKPKYYFSHHLSHAATAFQTSPFTQSAIVIADSIGEWDTTSIWDACYDREGNASYRKVCSQHYPYSLGLFYSSITQLAGFKPNSEENKLMELSKKGSFNQKIFYDMIEQLSYRNNHRGCLDMYPEVSPDILAFNAQKCLTHALTDLFRKANTISRNICFGGGVAFNKLAIDNLKQTGYNVYVPGNPGDAGSAIGAAALLYKKHLDKVEYK